MVEQAFGVIKSEKQGSDKLLSLLPILSVAETADDAVRASVALYFLHPVAGAGLIWQVDAFRNDAVVSTTCRRKPAFSVLRFQARGGETKEIAPEK